MEIRLKDFIQPGKIVTFVNFSGSFRHFKNTKKVAYVIDEVFHQNISVQKYFEKKLGTFSQEKFVDACRMVLLDPEIIHGNVSKLSYTEAKKLRFVEALLFHAETILFVNFEQGFTFKSRSYYQKLFSKLTKYGKCILLISDDISFLMNFVSDFILFEPNQYQLLHDFYDERIYKYVKMPEVISYIKYLETKGIRLEHYLETKEVLKAIYRSVSSK